MALCCTQENALDIPGEDDSGGPIHEHPGQFELGGPTGNTIINGTVTAIFHNNCNGYNQVGVIAGMQVNGGEGMGLSLNDPDNPYSRDKLWLDCGDKVTRKLDYSARGDDYQLEVIYVQSSYIDNWRTNQRVTTRQNFNNWSLNGSICNI